MDGYSLAIDVKIGNRSFGVIQVVMLYAPFAVAYQQVHGDAPANPLRVRTQDS